MSDQFKCTEIIYVEKAASKRCKWILFILFIIIILCVLFVFIGVPLIFMTSIELQRLLIFTHFGLPGEQIVFKKHNLRAGLNNFYVTVSDQNSNELISLGVWHLIPLGLLNASITNESFTFDNVLTDPTINILLYFHGTGESRSDSLRKYRVFQESFQVITFDYRSYADSTKATLSEEAVVRDCIQLYEWLLSKTNAPIYIWGHSLGSALAARTAAELQIKENLTQPKGLVLESVFTSMREELPRHPYGKIFAWLPYFKQTILDPLERNGFLFETRKNIAELPYPIMILNAEDDSIVPYQFGRKLCDKAINRTAPVVTYCYHFPDVFGYDHNFIYKDELLPLFIKYFIYQAEQHHNVSYSNVT